MKRAIGTVLALLGLTVLASGDDEPKAPPKIDEAVRKELAKLQGLWRCESYEEDGKAASIRAAKRRTIFFGGNRVMVRDGLDMIQAGEATLDPKAPGTIDLKILAGPFRNITMLGIYELKNDTLRICFDTAGRERPREYKSSKDSGLTVATYKRDRPREEPDLSGKYDCAGVEMDGSRYTAAVEVQRIGDAYTVTWNRGAGLTGIGVGLRRGNQLSVSFASKGTAGVVVYQLGKDGKLEGEWTDVGGVGILRTETLTPKK